MGISIFIVGMVNPTIKYSKLILINKISSDLWQSEKQHITNILRHYGIIGKQLLGSWLCCITLTKAWQRINDLQWLAFYVYDYT